MELAQQMNDRQNAQIGTVRISTLLEEGAMAAFLLLLAGILLMPETIGHALLSLLRLMNP
jgi:hypothetical protein